MTGPRYVGRRSIIGCLAVAIASVSLVALSQAGAQASSASITSSAHNLLVNGCFNDPSLGTPGHLGSYVGVSPGSTDITGWTVGAGGVQAVGTYWPKSPGCPGSLWLADDSPGFVSQSVPTTPGDQYLLRWEGGGTGETESPNPLRVLWGGVLVAVQNTPTTSWAPDQVKVTATKASTTVEFSATFSAGSDGPTIGSASLTLVPKVPKVLTVNGFVAPGLTGPYGSAEESMLGHLPSVAQVPSSAPDCTIQASSANQVNSGAGLQLVWTISPSAAYLKDSTGARASAAQTVERYLTNLMTKSMNLYSAALQAERVPETGAKDLANSWSVEVRSISTTGSLMTFSLTTSKAGTVLAWSNVPGVPSTAPQSTAATALATLLYYSKTIA